MKLIKLCSALLQNFGKDMVNLFVIPNLFSTIFIFSMFIGVVEGVSLSKSDGKSTMHRTLNHCQNLAMCSHDACNVGVARATWALCVLCERDARYVRAQHAGYGRIVCYVWAMRRHYGLSDHENGKNSSRRGHNAPPRMRGQVTFLRARSVVQRVIAPTLILCSKILYLC